MKVTDHFKNAKGKTLTSFEVLPPLKGGSMKSIFNVLDEFMEFQPPFIDVTYHREEYIYKQNEDGFYEKTAIRKRPGTVGICAAIMHKYGVDAVPHLICGGFTKEDTENALIDLNFLDINNVLALRGDARKFDNKFVPEKNGNKYAVDVVKQINNMNNGIYLDKDIVNGSKTDFCIGVAGYPEKHFEAPNIASDLHYTKEKIDAGGDYIVTQMFFDNKKYFKYVKNCRQLGIDVPIVAGIKPITKKYQLTSIPRMFFIDYPQDLVKAITKAKNDDHVKEIGMEWSIMQAKELIKKGVPCLHFYTMGDIDVVKKIVKEIL